MGQISTTSQLLGSLGVNVHVEYTDGKYANASNVVADLLYLGITHVRDAVLNPSNQGQWSYDVLAAAGIKFDLFFQGNNLSNSLGLVDAFVARHPGAVSLIEGPNEVNNFPISYAGQTGNSAAVAYQGALYTAVHADSSLANVPVANLTSYPDLAGAADLANFHSYPKGGAEPFSTLSADGQRQAASETGRPLVMTEGGYSTLLNGRYADGVDELTQAKYTLNIFLDNAKAGVSSSYIYELLDAYADQTNSDPEKHYGLFHLDNTPKLAATAIHDLTTILSAGSDGSAAASPLAFSTSGLPSTASTLTLTKAAGVHDLALWNEPTIWNATTQREVTAASAPVTIHLGALSDVTVYDPLSSTVAVQTLHNVQDVTLALSDHPLIVEVKDLPPSTPVAHPSVTVSLADGSIQTTTLNADGTILKHVTGIVGQSYASSDSLYSASYSLLSATYYNASGGYNVHLLNNPSFSSIDYTVDATGKLQSQTAHGFQGQVLSWTYSYATDGSSTQHYIDSSSNSSTDYVFDPTGKVNAVYVRNPDGSYTAHVLGNPSFTAIDYAVDTAGRLVSQIAHKSNGQTLSWNYSYNTDGSVTQHYVDSSSPNSAVNYIFDTGGRVSAVYAYSPDGSYTAHLLNNPSYAAVDYAVNPSGKLISQIAHGLDGRVLSWDYTYSDNGSVTEHYVDSSSTYSATDTVYGATGKVSAVYAYNLDGSYTAHLLNNPSFSAVDYAVDASGKLVTQIAHGFDGRVLSWDYRYDADGSRTQHYVDSSSSDAAIDTVTDSAGKVSAVYTYSHDGSYSAHLLNDPNHLTVDYSVGANGVLLSKSYTSLSGLTTVQLFSDNQSTTSSVADEVFQLLGASETVKLETSFGHDVVYGFTPGEDALSFSSSFSGKLSAALAHAADDGHGDALITLDAHNSVLLVGVAPASVLAHLGDYHLAA